MLPTSSAEEKTARIASRRASNYRQLRLLLEDPQTKDLDSTIATLALSGSAEMRLGSVSLARNHLRAVHYLLVQRDGLHTLQVMSGTTGLETMHSMHQLGSPMILYSAEKLRNSLNTVLLQLDRLSAWNHAARAEYSQSKMEFEHLQGTHPRLGSGPGLKTVQEGASYWMALQQCLGPSTVIGECLTPYLSDSSDRATRCQIGSLYSLNSMLYNLRHDQRRATSFLKDLAYIVNNSYSLSPSTNTKDEAWLQKLHITAVLPATIAHCAMRFGEWHDGSWRNTPPALRSWESLEFVELMMLMSPRRRYGILSMMHSWLTYDVHRLYRQAFPGELELEEAKQEVWTNWSAKNSVV